MTSPQAAVLEMPPYIVYPCVALAFGAISYLAWLMVSRYEPWMVRVRKEAKAMSEKTWIIRHTMYSHEGQVLGLETHDAERRKTTLSIHPDHPQIGEFRRLKPMDTVRFSHHPEGIGGKTMQSELCGYLRIGGTGKVLG